jgi:magnesium-transporting ATPase (P-type)
MWALLTLVNMCEPFIDRTDESFTLDGEFKENLKNSVLFIFQWYLQSCVIFVNYQGRPFMCSLRENGKLNKMLIFMFIVVICCVTDSSEDLREVLQLTPLPNQEFQEKYIKTLIIDFTLVNLIEYVVRTVYLGQNGYDAWGKALPESADKKKKD